MKINQDDLVYKSKHHFFNVWKLKNGYGIYNTNGVKVAYFEGSNFNSSVKHRAQRMAEICADALENEFQW